MARRYRIHRLVGSGSMGDVYQAYDTTLGTVVALKVPPTAHPNYAALKGLLPGEVRLAQRVSHPNVCRVFDLAIDDKLMVLSMEFIDGESLERILHRRVETLSWSERLRIAHEMCAGLSAIHHRGLIHRDLKPANVMIDSQGRTVIVDLGLAAEARAVLDPKSGTREYMAPEQLAGGEITHKADLYALGLVLYELFTGEHPYTAQGPMRSDCEEPAEPEARATASDGGRDAAPEAVSKVRDDLKRMQEAGRPIFRDWEGTRKAALAEQILCCLDQDPDRRPPSADTVAEALPPEPSALLHGASTPVYRLLTEPEGGGLGRRTAWACVCATVLGLVLVALLSQWTQPTQVALTGEPPSELEIRAHEILAQLGFDGSHKDRHSGFTYERDPERPLRFWYRQSPRRFAPWRKGSAFHRYEDPPFSVPGEVGIHLDPQGRLVRLDAIPLEAGSDPADGPFDWKPLLAAAGLESERLRPVASAWTPPVFADRRATWIREGPEEGAFRVEAAALQGLPVAFRLLPPRPAIPRIRADAEETRRGPSAVSTLIHVLGFSVVLLGALWLARRRLRERIADRPAAFRLALIIFGARVLVGLFGSHHRWSPIEFDLSLAVFSRGLFSAALVWVIYIAVEPWVRYYSPNLMASWIRLLYGRLRDPQVGRDLMAGGLLGLAILLWARLYVLVPTWLGLSPPRLDRLSTLIGMLAQEEVELQTEALNGFLPTLGMASYAVVHGVQLTFLLVTLLILLRRLLIHPWLSRSVAFLLYVVTIFPHAGHPVSDLVAVTGAAVLWFTVLFRFGFLATVTATVFTWLLSSHPLTLDPTSWAFEGAMVPLLLTLGISVWGFRAALGDQPILPSGFLRLRAQSG